MVPYHQAFRPSVGNLIVNGEDLEDDTLYIMLNFIIFLSGLSNYVASTACPGTVFELLVIIPVNFISFTCLHVVSGDFLKTRFTKCAQIQFISIISASTSTVQYRMV